MKCYFFLHVVWHPEKLQIYSISLKSDCQPPKTSRFICFNESPLEMMKNYFYFTLKAFFFLKIFKCLS